MIALMLIALCSSAQAGTLEEEMDYKVRAICDYMKNNNYHQCTLQPIGGIIEATGTNRIGAVIQDRFGHYGVELVGVGAQVLLDVEIALGPDDATLFVDLQLKTNKGQKLRDWSGEFEYDYGEKKVYVEADKGATTAEIDYADDVQKILSVPYAEHKLPIDPKEANKHKLKKLADAYDHPVTTIKDKSRVSTHESGLYQMEVVVTHDAQLSTDSYQPCHPDLKNGFSHLNLGRGDMLGVRLYNNSDEPVAVEVCLDGINSFFFSTLNSKYYMIKPHSQILVRGFHQSYDPHAKKHYYRHFQIVDYSDSAWLKAQQSGFAVVPDAQGSISAHFAKEARLVRGGSSRSIDLIGQGTEFEEKGSVAQMKVGPVVETIVVRYTKPGV